MPKELADYLPESITQFGAQTYQLIFDPATPAEFLPRLVDKALHSGRVFRLTEMLLDRIDPEGAQFDLSLAASIAYLHDIGRPEELLTTGNLGTSDFDHGKRGAEMIEASGLNLDGCNFTAEMIAVVVGQHNQFAVNGIGPDLLPYLQLIRDADKVDNLLLVKGDYLQSLGMQMSQFENSSEISPAVWERFIDPEETLVLNGEVRTFADRLLFLLSWFHELYYPQTLAYLVEEKIPERIFALMEELGIEERRIETAKQVFSQQSGLRF